MERKTEELVIQFATVLFLAPIIGLIVTILVMSITNPQSVFFLMGLLSFSLLLIIFYVLYSRKVIDPNRRFLGSFKVRFWGVVFFTFITLSLIHYQIPLIFSQTELYKPPWMCPSDAQLVVKELQITKIHSCKLESTMYEGKKATRVFIVHAPASLCNLGCVYNLSVALVVEGTVVRNSTQFP